jgi:hypothetical protein
MPAPLIPIIIAGANVVRMVAPVVATALTKSGLAKKQKEKLLLLHLVQNLIQVQEENLLKNLTLLLQLEVQVMQQQEQKKIKIKQIKKILLKEWRKKKLQKI